MKISVKQYAQALLESVAGKSEKELKAILNNFVAVLGRHGVLNKSDEIISYFAELWSQTHGELSADLFSARALSEDVKSLIINYIKDHTEAQQITLSEKIEPSLIGGFVLNYDSKIVDASLKSNLISLKNKISN